MTKVYMVVLYDMCGDSYNDRAFMKREDAINYAYEKVKNIDWLRESWQDEFEDADIENQTFEDWVKDDISSGIDECVYIDEINVY